ncbi:MAG: DUF4058 family protein [Planctomycetes bacterium]|nr:DUF4058 family protein [Planctomycetota bacterium]
MKSPFPGMDPFIEACGLWGDLHTHLIEKIYERLADAVPAHYLVRTGERNYVALEEQGGDKRGSFIPDVNVTSHRVETATDENVAVAEPTTQEPYSIRAFIDEELREPFVEILDADNGNRLVTCIEVLSPSNKKSSSAGWDLYQRKRQGLLLTGSANLIEIDLLRNGRRMPMADPWRPSPYRLVVARKGSAPHCKAWSACSLKPLPSIPVPLLRPDPDVPLDLQPMIDAIYSRSKYDRSIDYERPISPPLSPEETLWLDQRLSSRPAPA